MRRGALRYCEQVARALSGHSLTHHDPSDDGHLCFPFKKLKRLAHLKVATTPYFFFLTLFFPSFLIHPFIFPFFPLYGHLPVRHLKVICCNCKIRYPQSLEPTRYFIFPVFLFSLSHSPSLFSVLLLPHRCPSSVFRSLLVFDNTNKVHVRQWFLTGSISSQRIMRCPNSRNPWVASIHAPWLFLIGSVSLQTCSHK